MGTISIWWQGVAGTHPLPAPLQINYANAHSNKSRDNKCGTCVTFSIGLTHTHRESGSRKSLPAAWLSRGILALVLAFATSAADLRQHQQPQQQHWHGESLRVFGQRNVIIYCSTSLPVRVSINCQVESKRSGIRQTQCEQAINAKIMFSSDPESTVFGGRCSSIGDV